ncbi:unnamed protein product [Aphanomyces euteiches]
MLQKRNPLRAHFPFCHQQLKMPISRELKNKKNDHKDRQSRGRAGSGAEPKKHGAGSHNWGTGLESDDAPVALDRGDPNYDSDEGKAAN